MIRLSTNNIVENWDLIRFAAIKVAVIDQKFIPDYCRNLLINLLTGNSQCWFYLTENRQIVNVTITRLQTDLGGIPHLLIDCSYGFTGSNDDQKAMWIETLLEFAENVGCDSIIAYTSNPVAVNAMKKMDMTELFKIYQRKVI